jgi:hypothetical protein
MPKVAIPAWIVVLAMLIVGAALTYALLSSTSPSRASPEQQAIHVQGVLEFGYVCTGCGFLQTDSGRYELLGDLEGCTCGDSVDVWGRLYHGSTTCMEGTAVIVENVVGGCTTEPDPPVGGIAELPGVASDSGSSTGTYAALAGGLAAAVVALSAGAWYARKRWGR